MISEPNSQNCLAIEPTLKRMAGDTDLLKTLFNLYLEDTPCKIEKIKTAISSNDLYTVERSAHSIKGASATIGAVLMQEKALNIEMAGKNKEQDAAEQAISQLDQIFEATRQAIAEFNKS